MREIIGLCELLIALVATMWPVFFFASSIDGDEFMKFGFGASSLAVVGVYKLWKSHSLRSKSQVKCRTCQEAIELKAALVFCSESCCEEHCFS